MKRIGSLIIALVMLFCFAGASAEVDYTLAEKLQNQMKAGSGLSGSLTLTAEGTSPLALSMQGIRDTEIQIRALRSGMERHAALFLAGGNDSREGLTELLQQEETWYFRSDLLPGNEVWQLPDAFEAAAETVPAPAGGNPAFLPALIRLAQMSQSKRDVVLAPVTTKLSAWLEVWLADYAGVSQVRKLDNGTSGVDLMYSIPMSEIRKEIVALLKAIVRDSDGQALLNAIMTEEQMEVYANPYLDYYYLDAMDALDNDYDVVFTRTMTTLGQTVGSSLEMPLDENRTGFQTLEMVDNGGLISITLRGDDRLLAVQIPREMDFSKIDSASIWICSRGPQGEDEQSLPNLAARIDLSHESTLSSDEDNRLHLREIWGITGTYDVSRLPEGERTADYPETEALEGIVSLHYSSRNAQASPTTLEIEGSLRQGESLNLGVKGQLKTVAPWVFTPFATEEARELVSLSGDERTVLMAELLTAAGELCQRSKDSSTAETDETAEEPAETSDTEEAVTEDKP